MNGEKGPMSYFPGTVIKYFDQDLLVEEFILADGSRQIRIHHGGKGGVGRGFRQVGSMAIGAER